MAEKEVLSAKEEEILRNEATWFMKVGKIWIFF